MVRVSGMAHAKQETKRDDGEEVNHSFSFGSRSSRRLRLDVARLKKVLQFVHAGAGFC
jgi:hypothetical protein